MKKVLLVLCICASNVVLAEDAVGGEEWWHPHYPSASLLSSMPSDIARNPSYTPELSITSISRTSDPSGRAGQFAAGAVGALGGLVGAAAGGALGAFAGPGTAAVTSRTLKLQNMDNKLGIMFQM